MSKITGPLGPPPSPDEKPVEKGEAEKKTEEKNDLVFAELDAEPQVGGGEKHLIAKEGVVKEKKSSAEKDVKKAERHLRKTLGKLLEETVEKTESAEKGIKRTKKVIDAAVTVAEGVSKIQEKETGELPSFIERLEVASEGLEKIENVLVTGLFIYNLGKATERVIDGAKLKKLESKLEKANEALVAKKAELEKNPTNKSLQEKVDSLQQEVDKLFGELEKVTDKLNKSAGVKNQVIKYSIKEGKIVAKFAGKTVLASTLGVFDKAWGTYLQAKGIKRNSKKHKDIIKQLNMLATIASDKSCTPAEKEMLKLKIEVQGSLYDSITVDTIQKGVRLGTYSLWATSAIASTGVLVAGVGSAIATATSGAGFILANVALGVGGGYCIYRNRHNIRMKGKGLNIAKKKTLNERNIKKTEKELQSNYKTLEVARKRFDASMPASLENLQDRMKAALDREESLQSLSKEVSSKLKNTPRGKIVHKFCRKKSSSKILKDIKLYKKVVLAEAENKLNETKIGLVKAQNQYSKSASRVNSAKRSLATTKILLDNAKSSGNKVKQAKYSLKSSATFFMYKIEQLFLKISGVLLLRADRQEQKARSNIKTTMETVEAFEVVHNLSQIKEAISDVKKEVQNLQKLTSNEKKNIKKMKEKNWTAITKKTKKIQQLENQKYQLLKVQKEIATQKDRHRELSALRKPAKAANKSPEEIETMIKSIEAKIDSNSADNDGVRRMIEHAGINVNEESWGDPISRRELLIKFFMSK
ncbi:MAG: hypothetical protein VX777_02565 [Chlamydiota bacterium]|nr:hypothetical protein [Chlamydiota bacterium]